MQLKYSKSSQQLIAHRLLVCRRSHPHCRMLLTRGCLGTKGRDLVSQLCMAQSYWTENTRLFGENTLPPSACFCLSPPLSTEFFQSPADSSCLQSERQSESSRGLLPSPQSAKNTIFHMQSFSFTLLYAASSI